MALDPIYTGKLMYGIFDLIGNGFFKKGNRILAVHTGGLQGIKGFNQRFGELIK
jgi:1-aminocyclopropane-1-carboxylate deaminase